MVDEQVDDGCSKVDGKMLTKEWTSIYPSINFLYNRQADGLEIVMVEISNDCLYCIYLLFQICAISTLLESFWDETSRIDTFRKKKVH